MVSRSPNNTSAPKRIRGAGGGCENKCTASPCEDPYMMTMGHGGEPPHGTLRMLTRGGRGARGCRSPRPGETLWGSSSCSTPPPPAAKGRGFLTNLHEDIIS